MKVLIMAGGQGTRLWPLSRPHQPKQLQPLFSDKSLLQTTVERAKLLVATEDIYIVVSNEFQLSEVKKQIPYVPSNNILKEPESKNTAAAICYGASVINNTKPENEPMLVLPADHIIKNPEALIDAVKMGTEFLENNPEKLLILGITPSYPETGYGYIEKGKKISDGLYAVNSFKEKPTLKGAKKYLKNNKYFWNAGIFLWKIKTVLAELHHYSPLHKTITETVQNNKKLKNAYASVPDIAFDYAVSEKTPNLAVLPTDLDWTDVGHWKTVKDVLQKQPNANVITGQHLGINTSNCLIINQGKHLIGTVGVEDLIIITTDDAILICKEDSAQDVRKLVNKINETRQK